MNPRRHRTRSPSTTSSSSVFSMIVTLIVAIAVSSRLPGPVAGANWAQVSGQRQTNAAILEPTPWARRHGHAVAALDFPEDYVRTTGQRARLFVLGGDSSVQGQEDLRAYPGGGSLRNDVWATTGITWSARTNILKTTKWGDPLAQTIANLTWLQTNNGKRPPRGVTYREWLACAANAWAVDPVDGCDDPTRPPGAYLADNMFSPRRNFVALAFQRELWVLGGQAREHAPVPEAELRGGGVGGIGPRNVRWREHTVLRNDVWRSGDAGASWRLVTPGCPGPEAPWLHKAGPPTLQCVTDDDCEGDAGCQWDPRTSTGTCVCRMWGPREFHAVAVHDDALFLSGGYALVQLGNCGVEEHARRRPAGEEFACGGGYRAYLDDLWTSRDGQTWRLVSPHAGFAPRGEHALLSFQSRLVVLGGRTGQTIAAPVTTATTTGRLLNDVWVSSNGSRWHALETAAPWSPRAKHVALVLPGAADVASGEDPEDELVLLYGEDEERALDDVWTWHGPGRPWIRDYDPDTAAGDYVAVTSDVAYLKGMTPAHAALLRARGLGTIDALVTQVTFDQTLALRPLMPICDYLALAREIRATCSIHADANEGDEYKNLVVIQGQATPAPAPGAAGDAAASAWDGCAHIGPQVVDARTKRLRWVDVKGIDQVPVLRDIFDDAQGSVCRWGPRPRTGHAGAVFQRKVFVLGGLTAPDYFENDAWYRVARRPRAQLLRAPATGTSQTLFRFESDVPGCTFEYHVTNLVEMLVVRNWTKTLGEVDVLSWLDGGKYRFRVRALDPAGNVDVAFEAGRNEHVWVYKPKLPWALILGLSSVVVVLLLGLFLEWRKRRKRAAMERYAMKRMRRKLKGSKKGVGNTDANWRETYDEAKDATGKKDKKKKGKVVGAKADKTKDKKDPKSKDKKAKGSKETKDKTKKKKATTTKDKDAKTKKSTDKAKSKKDQLKERKTSTKTTAKSDDDKKKDKKPTDKDKGPKKATTPKGSGDAAKKDKPKKPPTDDKAKKQKKK